ncbi:MAG: DUF2905 domain-containing protein [Aquificae bacterium]|nr:DUF2905 domain-containing protein [Aquificota bacterium]
MELWKIFTFLGFLFLFLGLLGFIFSKLNLSLGQLPGDIVLRKENFTVYIPIASSLLISLLLTVVLNLLFLLLDKK